MKIKELFKNTFKKIDYSLASNFFGDNHFVQRGGAVNMPNSFHNLLPYRYFDEATGLYINQVDGKKGQEEETVGFLIEATPILGCSEADIDILSNFFNDNLPEGLVLQIINYASPRVGDLLDSWKAPREKEGGVYKDLAEKRIEYLTKGCWKSLFPSPFVVRDFKIYISASLSKAQYHDAESILKKLRVDFESNLNNVNIKTKNTNPSALLSLLDELLNPDTNLTHKSNIKWDKLDPINVQACDSESVFEIKHNQLELKDDVVARSFSAKSYPEIWIGSEMINLLGANFRDNLRLSCPFISCLTIEVPNLNKSKNRAILREQILETRSRSQLAKFWKNVDKMARDWKYVKDHIDKGQRLVTAKYNVILLTQKDRIDLEEEKLKAIYTPNNWRLKRDDYLHLPSFLSVLPFYINSERFKSFSQCGKTKTVLTWTCTNIAPLQGEFRGAIDQPRVMMLGKRGQPLFWNPYYSPEAGGNYNVVVTGKSGSGKSVFIQDLAASIRGTGGLLFIIDNGESFRNSSTLQGGKFIKIDSDICINPFTMFDWDAMKTASYEEDILNFFTCLVAQITRPITPITEDEKALITLATKRALKKGKDGNLELISKELENVATTDHQKELVTSLKLSLDVFLMKYGSYFKGQSDIKMEAKFTVFEMSNLEGAGREDLKSVVMMIIMHLISELIYKGDRSSASALMIDEAWTMLSGEGMKEFINGYVRRVRKFGGSLITASQSINDYYENPAAKAVLDNSQWKVFLAQNSDAVDYLKENKIIKMNPMLEESLKRLRMVGGCYSEAIVYGDAGWYVGRLLLDTFSIFLYSSKAEDVFAIEKLKKQGLSVDQAINKLINKEND